MGGGRAAGEGGGVALQGREGGWDGGGEGGHARPGRSNHLPRRNSLRRLDLWRIYTSPRPPAVYIYIYNPPPGFFLSLQTQGMPKNRVCSPGL